MTAWLKQNWKYLLVAVAGFVVVVLLYLRSRSSSGASTISFPGGATAGGSAADAASTAASDVAGAVQGFFGQIRAPGGAPTWDPTHKGIPLWSGIGTGNLLELVPFGSNVQILDTAQGPPNAVSGETTYYKIDWGGIVGWISSFDLASFLGQAPAGFGQPGAVSSNPAPSSLPGTGSTSSGAAQLGPLGSLSTTGFGVGGPGLAFGNLQRAALAAQAAAHRATLTNPRLGRRLAQDAVQAARESRRIGVESRGAAPVGGPGAMASGLRRVRWPR